MKFFTKKRIIIGSIILVVVLILIIVCFTIHFKFFKYTYVKNDQDILTKVNINFYSPTLHEKINIKEFANSLTAGYEFLDPSYFDDNVLISNLSDEQIIFLNYLFITGGKKDTCIEKKYFLKMANIYFGKDKLKWKSNDSNNGYDWLLHAYCFQKNTDFNNSVVLSSFTENNNYYVLEYNVRLDDKTIETEKITNKVYTILFDKKEIPMINKLSVTYDDIEVEE